MLLPSSGLGSKGPARGTVDVTHAKKKKKKKKRHCKKGYVLKRVIRGKGKHRHYVMRGKGKHRHYVRRCRKVKKKKALVPPPESTRWVPARRASSSVWRRVLRRPGRRR